MILDMLQPAQRLHKEPGAKGSGAWQLAETDFTGQVTSVSRVEMRLKDVDQLQLLQTREARILKPYAEHRASNAFDQSAYLRNYATTHRSSTAPLVMDLEGTLRAYQQAKKRPTTGRECYNCHKRFDRPEEHPFCRMNEAKLQAAHKAAKSYQPRPPGERKQRQRNKAPDGKSPEDAEDSESEADDDGDCWSQVDAAWKPSAASRASAAPRDPAAADTTEIQEAPKREHLGRSREATQRLPGGLDSSRIEFGDSDDDFLASDEES